MNANNEKQYFIYDVCVRSQKDSDWPFNYLLDKPLDKDTWLGLLAAEIDAYAECMSEENIVNHWKLTLYEMFKGQPIEINGLEFVIK